MGREQKVTVVIGAMDKASGVFDNLTRGAMERFGHKITDLLSNLPQMAGEMLKLGADAETASFRFTKFAGGVAEADEYLAAFQLGADGAVSKMDAMTSGARMLQMGIAENAEEMEFMAAAAIKLGDQTKASGERIADWSAMLANQSIPRLDNFGIASGKVRTRMAELLATGQALSRDQAFKMAVMEEGGKALETLGDTTDLMITKIDKYTAAIDNAKTDLALMAADAATEMSELEGYWGQVFSPQNIGNIVDTAAEVWGFVKAVDEASRAASYGADFNAILLREMRELEDGQGELTAATDAMTGRWRTYTGAQAEAAVAAAIMSAESEELAGRLAGVDKAVAEYNRSWHAAEQVGWQAESAMVDLADGINEAGSAADTAEWKAMALARSLKEMDAAAVANRSALLDMTMSWTGFFDRTEEQAADWAEGREKAEQGHVDKLATIEENHFDRLAKIQGKGRSTAIRLDAAAEEEKLADLKWRLELALLQQAEFGEKVRESTSRSKEHQIEELRGQITTQETLLGDYYGGRLIRQGANISSELTAEEVRYAEELRLASESHTEQMRLSDEAQAEMAEAQRRNLGQNLLQSFESWARMKEIPAEEMLEMRTAIAQEYGLIDDETANLITYMTGQWTTWAEKGGENTEAVLGNLDMYMERSGLASTATMEDTDAMAGDWSRFKDKMIEDAGTIVESMDDVIGKAGDLTTALNEIPTKIDVEIAVTTVGTLGGGGLQEMQSGTRHFRGGLAMVGERGPELGRRPDGILTMLGERGPELRWLPAGTEIWSAGETRRLKGGKQGAETDWGLGGSGDRGYGNSPGQLGAGLVGASVPAERSGNMANNTNTRTVGSHNVYNIYDMRTAEYIFERERRERREALTRMM